MKVLEVVVMVALFFYGSFQALLDEETKVVGGFLSVLQGVYF